MKHRNAKHRVKTAIIEFQTDYKIMYAANSIINRAWVYAGSFIALNDMIGFNNSSIRDILRILNEAQ